MEWVRAHPYACGVLGAGALIIAGAIVVKTHASLAIPSGMEAWSGGSGAIVGANSPQGESGAPAPAGLSSAPTPTSTESIDTGTLPYTAPAQNTLVQGSAPSSAQLSALLTELSHPGTQNTTNTQSTASASGTISAYAFIPTGEISVQNASQEQYTLSQQELYSYGNAAGSYIQSYEERDASQAQVLTDSVQSRSDGAKSAAVAQVGADLITVGEQLAGIADVPAQAQSDNAALSQSYEAAGAALQKVAAATNGSDANFVAAMEAYDATANTFVGRYVALSLLFSANGIVFGADDPGSVFSFNESGGL